MVDVEAHWKASLSRQMSYIIWIVMLDARYIVGFDLYFTSILTKKWRLLLFVLLTVRLGLLRHGH